MSHRSRASLSAALLSMAIGFDASAVRAEYLICWRPQTVEHRISCEPGCDEDEWLWERVAEEWAGCGTEGPDCGTAWGEWEHYLVVAPDPCSASCWRTVTVDSECRITGEAKQERDLWQCQGVRAANQ